MTVTDDQARDFGDNFFFYLSDFSRILTINMIMPEYQKMIKAAAAAFLKNCSADLCAKFIFTV